MLAVSDSGAGITPENMPFIFDPFFTTKGMTQGAGTAMNIQLMCIDTQLIGRQHRDDGECLVDFEQIDIMDGPPDL